MLVAVRGGEGPAVQGMASGLGGVRGGVREYAWLSKESGRLSDSSMAVWSLAGTSGDCGIGCRGAEPRC